MIDVQNYTCALHAANTVGDHGWVDLHNPNLVDCDGSGGGSCADQFVDAYGNVVDLSYASGDVKADDANKKCLKIKASDSKIEDKSCTDTYGYICEADCSGEPYSNQIRFKNMKLTIVVYSGCPNPPSGYTQGASGGTKYYKKFTTSADYSTAASSCRSDEAWLAMTKTQNDHNDLTAYLTSAEVWWGLENPTGHEVRMCPLRATNLTLWPIFSMMEVWEGM